MNLRASVMRLVAAPRKALDWLRHPDQALVRIEARWVFRWFSRFPGLAWSIRVRRFHSP